MGCCIRNGRWKISGEWGSPGVKEMLLKLYSGAAMDMDHELYEFGGVEYHIKCSLSDPTHSIYLSISTPNPVSSDALETIQRICPSAVDIVEQARHHLTLRLNLPSIPTPPKPTTNIIAQIASLQSIIAISHFKQVLRNLNEDRIPGPIKLVYHAKHPFFIINQAHKITALLPMRFKQPTDLIIATSFFQELMDAGNCEEWVKVPRCSWSPIPPPELRGVSIQDLSTNGGFVSFDILPRHIEEKRVDKTLWNLLNFYAFVKSHVKCTRGFIQRKLRNRLEDLVKALHTTILDDEPDEEEAPGCGYNIKLKASSKVKKIKRRCGDLSTKLKRIRYRIKIHRFRRHWFSLPRFSSPHNTKLSRSLPN